MTPTRKLALSLLTIALSISLSVGIGALILSWKYSRSFHSILKGGQWPINSYRYNSAIRNFELSPSFSKPIRRFGWHLKTHELGYRIPKFSDHETYRPGGLLSIGCSFTFGHGVDAKNTFTYLAGSELGIDSYNYGVSSYSYASSIIQLEDLDRRGVLDQLEPSVIVLGAGAWLTVRSLTPFYPTNGLQLAYPYISNRDGEIEITYPPDFISVAHAVGLVASGTYFDHGKKRVPLTLRRRLLLLDSIPRVLVAKTLRRYFENKISPYELYSFVLPRISRIAQRLGARLIVMNMPLPRRADSEAEEGLRQAVDECGCATLVDGLQALRKFGALDAKRNHPDRKAHAVYAHAIVEALRSDSEGALDD